MNKSPLSRIISKYWTLFDHSGGPSGPDPYYRKPTEYPGTPGYPYPTGTPRYPYPTEYPYPTGYPYTTEYPGPDGSPHDSFSLYLVGNIVRLVNVSIDDDKLPPVFSFDFNRVCIFVIKSIPSLITLISLALINI